MNSGRVAFSKFDWILGWRNLWRNPLRTLLALLAIGIAQFVLIWIDSFLNGYEALIQKELTGPMIGDLQIHHPTYRRDPAIDKTLSGVDELESGLRDLPHVAQVLPRIYVPVLLSRQQEGEAGLVVGLDFSRENGPGNLLEGLTSDRFPGPREAVMGNGLAREMHIRPGDEVALMGQGSDGSIASELLKIKGIVSTASDPVNQNGLIMEISVVRALFNLENQAHELIIHTDGLVRPDDIRSRIHKMPGFGNLETMTWRELSPHLADLLNVFRGANLIVLTLVFVTTISGVANTLFMSTFERTHEFGMLLSLGCRPERLNRILLFEAMIQGILGGLVGTLCALLVVMHQSHGGIDLNSFLPGNEQRLSLSIEGLKLTFVIFPKFSPIDPINGFAAILVTSMIACWIPARRMNRLEPAEALRA